MNATTLADAIAWNDDGLVPVVAQDAASGEILMFAWMNREALAATVAEGRMVYWSRSRKRLWRKGEESGHVQVLKGLRLDCDGDALVAKVEQRGGIACHTGRRSCFFQEWREARWQAVEPVIKSPDQIYGGDKPAKADV